MTTGLRLGLALLAVATVVLVSATGAVSSVVMERSVAIDVVDDGDAPVGIAVDDVSTTNATATVEIAVENRLGEPLTVRAESERGTVAGQDGVLESGERTTIVTTVECDGGEHGSVSIDVSAESEATAVEQTLDVTPCTGVDS